MCSQVDLVRYAKLDLIAMSGHNDTRSGIGNGQSLALDEVPHTGVVDDPKRDLVDSVVGVAVLGGEVSEWNNAFAAVAFSGIPRGGIRPAASQQA